MIAGGHNTDDELVIVARAVRTRGLKGELVAELLTDFPERFETLESLVSVAPSGERNQFEIENYWFQNDRVVLKFSGYDDIEAAKRLIGCEFGVPETERVTLAENEFYDWELEGCLVEDKSGAVIGKVREILRTGGVELLVVENDQHYDHMIPMAAAIVTEIDIAGKKIVVDPPAGLLDL
jgi:16S rRNA processing protein RimM